MEQADWIEARDRSLSRLIDYDLKVLTVLFALIVAWTGVGKLVEFSGDLVREMVEVVLATSALAMSQAWGARRTFLFRIDDQIAMKCVEPYSFQLSIDSKNIYQIIGQFLLRKGHIVTSIICFMFFIFSIFSLSNKVIIEFCI